MKVPFVDLAREHAPYLDALRAVMNDVVASGRYVLGPHLERFELDFAKSIGAAHAVGVSSGTDALLLALMAEGIGPGDVVVTTPYSFFSTASVAVRLGADVAFVDIDPVSFAIDPSALGTWLANDPRSERTRALVLVHLFGHPADTSSIAELCTAHDLVLVEDTAQAIGTHGADGRHVGSAGAYGCFSFFPTKNLGAIGDAGLVVTQDAARAERIRSLRSYGQATRLVHQHLGGNHRMDELQAAALGVMLPYLNEKNARRISIAHRYDAALPDAPARPAKPAVHSFHQYVHRVPNRDDVRKKLAAEGIDTNVYYSTPLHRQPCFARMDPHAVLPEAERAAMETLALPIRPTMTDDMVQHVIDRLRAAVG